jgi:hypothetical protein
MNRGSAHPRPLPAVLLAVVLGSSAACEGLGHAARPDPVVTVTVYLDPASASVPQGGETQVTVGVAVRNRTDTQDAPTLEFTTSLVVTPSVGTPQRSGSEDTWRFLVTVRVLPGDLPGEKTFDVIAKVAGVEGRRSFGFTVTPASYSLALSPATLSVARGGTGTSTVKITRVDFASPLTLTVTGAPDHVTATVDPPSITGDTATLAVTAGANAAEGTYTLTVAGPVQGLPDQRVRLTLTIVGTGGHEALTPPGMALTPQP